MQACEVCGWDTREGTRVCPSCRAQQQAPDAADPGVLAGVLRAARDVTADAGDEGRSTPEGQPRSTASRRPRGPHRDDDGREQVVLREIEPGGDDRQPPRPVAASSVAASLLEAFQPRPDAGAPPAGSVSDPEESAAAAGEVPPAGLVGATDDTPSDAEREAPGDPVETLDVTDRLMALARPPAGDEDADDGRGIRERSSDVADALGPAAPVTNARPGGDAVAAGWAPDDQDPITDRFANIPTVPIEPGPPAGPAVDAPADGAAATDPTPVPVDDIGDATVPPAPVREATAADAPTAEWAASSAQATATAATAAASGDRPPETAGTQGQAPDTPAWRATLREAGAWTTVAQFTLLFIGMLCVFQVVVLLVVNQFLSQAQSQATVAADMLAAHAKVATVMLPALVGGAFATAGFAAWRAYADPRERDDTAWLRRRLAGLPIAIWTVIVTATLLLVVVASGTSATVAEAQRTTLWAIGACSLLGVACVAAPRGLATQEADEVEETAPASGLGR